MNLFDLDDLFDETELEDEYGESYRDEEVYIASSSVYQFDDDMLSFCRRMDEPGVFGNVLGEPSENDEYVEDDGDDEDGYDSISEYFDESEDKLFKNPSYPEPEELFP